MFRKYPKIIALGKEEVEGILEGVVHVEEKIDGANTSIWWDDGIKCGTRTREILEGFNGFYNYVQTNPAVQNFFSVEDNRKYRLYGEWLCLSGDTVIKKTSGGKATKGNYMTLREMYKYLKTPLPDRTQSWWEKNGFPKIYSLDMEKDRVLPNRIKNIVSTGNKEVYKITTREGLSIKATKEHPFLTQVGFVSLGQIMDEGIEKFCVAVSDLRAERTNARLLGVGSRRILKRQKEFTSEKGRCVKCGSENSLELDHIDENWENNDEENWQVLCSSCHRSKSGLAQGKRKPHAKGYSYRFDTIADVSFVGVEDTYDVEMEGGEEVANFVANGFVVHNCRHTISYAKTSYKEFYLFDISDITVEGEVGKDEKTTPVSFLTRNRVRGYGDTYKFKMPQEFGVFENPSEEDIKKFVGESNLGDKGEGVVIKNQEYLNKFGRHCYAKVVTEKFKEDNAIVFGGNNKHAEHYWEMYVA